MASNSRVAIVKCDSYDQAQVDVSIHKSLEYLGGISQFVKPGQKVLIKPNILLSKPPEAAATTHPSIITAVVKEVLQAGGVALVGDSPGNAIADALHSYEITGIKKAAEEAGGKIVHFQQEGIVDVKSPSDHPRMKEFKITKAALDADVIINLPKLKTHNLTAYTGAIKNMFGVVPGFYKTMFHRASPDPYYFARSLVDIYQIAKPSLNIMDAVIGMEGPGPSNGIPRKMGLIIASADGVAMDAVGSYLIGLKPDQIDTTINAYERKLGEMRLDKIEVLGEKLDGVRQADWKRSFNVYSLVKSWLPGFVYQLIAPLISQAKVLPSVNQQKCVKCLVCVKHCPVQTINYDPKLKKVEINQKNCINCFCCHELCEYDAIDLKRTWAVRLLGVGED